MRYVRVHTAAHGESAGFGLPASIDLLGLVA